MTGEEERIDIDLDIKNLMTKLRDTKNTVSFYFRLSFNEDGRYSQAVISSVEESEVLAAAIFAIMMEDQLVCDAILDAVLDYKRDFQELIGNNLEEFDKDFDDDTSNIF